MQQNRNDGKQVRLQDALYALSLIPEVTPSWNIVTVKPDSNVWRETCH